MRQKNYGRYNRAHSNRKRLTRNTACRCVRIFCRTGQIRQSERAKSPPAILHIFVCGTAVSAIWYICRISSRAASPRWKVAERMTAQLVIDVFLQARRRGLIGRNALIRSGSRQPSALRLNIEGCCISAAFGNQ